MAFNENAFVLAGTSIAIFGVALYIWDTRKGSVLTSFNQPTGQTGGSRSNRRKNSHKKTKRH
jgi:hypothetical protein